MYNYPSNIYLLFMYHNVTMLQQKFVYTNYVLQVLQVQDGYIWGYDNMTMPTISHGLI